MKETNSRSVVAADLDEKIVESLAEHRWPPPRDIEPLVRRDRYLARIRAELLSVLDNSDSLARRTGRAAGSSLGLVRFLPWDSEQLALKCGRLELFVGGAPSEEMDRLLRALVSDAKRRGFEHLTARVPSYQHRALRALFANGFKLTDCLLIFGGRPNGHASTERTSIELETAGAQDIESIKDIARGAFRYDRFHADPGLPQQVADELYAAWAENSCRQKVSDIMLVARDEEHVLGFVALSTGNREVTRSGQPIGAIDLVAVSERYRGQGVGASLLKGASRWFAGQQALAMHVGTQSANVAAARLYERSGFLLSSSHYTLLSRLEDE